MHDGTLNIKPDYCATDVISDSQTYYYILKKLFDKIELFFCVHIIETLDFEMNEH